MKRALYLFAAAIILFLASCESKVDDQQKNDSLSKSEETVIYEVSLEVDPEAVNWMGNIDQKKMLTKIFSQVENGELEAYGALSDPDGESILWEEILSAMDANPDTTEVMDVETGEYSIKISSPKLMLNEIKSLLFIEEWTLTTNGTINKEVLGIAPVRHFYSTQDTLKKNTRKRIIFVSYYGEKKPVLFERY
ncbi:MAG: hypothetical protein U9R19_14485 [Bacteroidota bacterium]|nr:hypothetical protein [Bacteroidota bacterium]